MKIGVEPSASTIPLGSGVLVLKIIPKYNLDSYIKIFGLCFRILFLNDPILNQITESKTLILVAKVSTIFKNMK